MNSEMTHSSDILSDIEKLNFSIIRGNEISDFVSRADEVSIPSWPEFMMHDQVANRFWYRFNTKFPDFQFALVDNVTGKWLAVGNSAPVSWSKPFEELPDKGWDWALESSMAEGFEANVLCALAIQILPHQRGKGLSPLMVRIMKEVGSQNGFDQLIAPVRTYKKSDYPLLPMVEYLTWTRNDGESFDPWIRVHERLGAKIVKVCPEAMLIQGSVQQWEEWTKMSFKLSPLKSARMVFRTPEKFRDWPEVVNPPAPSPK